MRGLAPARASGERGGGLSTGCCAGPCLLFRIAVGFASRRDCVFAKESMCYYACNPNMDGCLQCSTVDIVMVNKSATPKSRRVCEVCSDWLLFCVRVVIVMDNRERFLEAFLACVGLSWCCSCRATAIFYESLLDRLFCWIGFSLQCNCLLCAGLVASLIDDVLEVGCFCNGRVETGGGVVERTSNLGAVALQGCPVAITYTILLPIGSSQTANQCG